MLLPQAELAASRKSLAMQESMMRKMSEQLLKEGEAVAALKAELAEEQTAAKALRDKLAKVCMCMIKACGQHGCAICYL